MAQRSERAFASPQKFEPGRRPKGNHPVKRPTRTRSAAELDFETAQRNYQRALRDRSWAEAEIFLKASIRTIDQQVTALMAWAHEAREDLASLRDLLRMTRIKSLRRRPAVAKEQKVCARKTA